MKLIIDVFGRTQKERKTIMRTMFVKSFTSLLLVVTLLSFGFTSGASAHSMNPKINPIPCSNSAWEAMVHSTSSGYYCYTAAGYTGINPNVYNVDFVSTNCAYAWFMTYKTNGSSGVKVNAYNARVNGPWYKVTQVNIFSTLC